MPIGTVEAAYKLQEKYGFTFAVCDWGTKSEGHSKGWNDNPLTAEQVKQACLQKRRNLKVLTGPKSNCIAVDVDDPDLAAQYRRQIGASTLAIRTSRGYRWFFALPSGLMFTKINLPDGAEIMGDRFSGTAAGRHKSGKDYDIECLPDGPLPEPPDWILNPLKAIIAEKNRRPVPTNAPPVEGDLALASKALDVLNPDMPYDEWVNVGMALHNLDASNGLSLWDSWSSRGAKYKPNICAMKWKSFKPGGITRATLFSMADKASPGWRPGPIIQRRAQPIAKPLIIHEKIEPGYITRESAAMINRIHAQKAGAILDVWRAALKLPQPFTPSMVFQNTDLTIAQIHRGLMYGNGTCFERHNDDFIAPCASNTVDSSDSDLSSMDNKSPQDARKLSQRHRPSSQWKVKPFEQMVKVLCREIFQIELERTNDVLFATHSRMRDLKSSVGAATVNRTLQKLMSTEERVNEKKKLKDLVQQSRDMQRQMLTDLTPIASGDAPVRTIMANEWLDSHKDGEQSTMDAVEVTGMSRETLKRIGLKLGYYSEPQQAETVIHKPENLPVPREFNTEFGGFPQLVSTGGHRYPYSSSHDVARVMEAMRIPAKITWQLPSIIRYDPVIAAMELEKQGQRTAAKISKPRKEGRENIDDVEIEWNGIGNPPNWTRRGWAYPWLCRMGYEGNYDNYTDAQIVDMMVRGGNKS